MIIHCRCGHVHHTASGCDVCICPVHSWNEEQHPQEVS